MFKLIDENGDVEIDLNDVIKCDVAGVQLILSLLNSHRRGKIILENISDAVRETALNIGIDPEILSISKKGACNEQEHYDCR